MIPHNLCHTWSEPIMDFPSPIAGKSHFMRSWSWWILIWCPQSVLSQFVASTCPQIFLLFAMHINDMYHRYAYVKKALNDWVIKPKNRYDFSLNHFLPWKHLLYESLHGLKFAVEILMFWPERKFIIWIDDSINSIAKSQVPLYPTWINFNPSMNK